MQKNDSFADKFEIFFRRIFIAVSEICLFRHAYGAAAPFRYAIILIGVERRVDINQIDFSRITVMQQKTQPFEIIAENQHRAIGFRLETPCEFFRSAQDLGNAFFVLITDFHNLYSEYKNSRSTSADMIGNASLFCKNRYSLLFPLMYKTPSAMAIFSYRL